ncbi:fructosamine kinase family protein [uncultured Pseudokineococcus sp.]|uniref:fructosamine kinase family protein n=1 Tax=uncultured Pseudokineococcus sp. TaxID=1642928 RepID=UPI002624584D|nr:fructosamine kinase family protein [uncultured Pseudokineococcus sp.]
MASRETTHDDLPTELGEVVERRRLGGGDIGASEEVRLADGRRLFVKRYAREDGAEMVASEAAGLRWLAGADGGPPVPEVVAAQGQVLALELVDVAGSAASDDEGLERFGRELAALHDAGADAFGAVPGGASPHLGSLRVPVEPTSSWPAFWAQQRVLPLARLATDRGRLAPRDLAAVEGAAARAEEVMGPPEPPSRCHGDLWWGNVVRARDGRRWLLDPSALGGHREADLALLDLFGGLPPRLVAAYEEVHPLADGWEGRVALHQLVPLLVHAALFGGPYGPAAGEAARTGL